MDGRKAHGSTRRCWDWPYYGTLGLAFGLYFVLAKDSSIQVSTVLNLNAEVKIQSSTTWVAFGSTRDYE